jgi:hypothetical protein
MQMHICKHIYIMQQANKQPSKWLIEKQMQGKQPLSKEANVLLSEYKQESKCIMKQK